MFRINTLLLSYSSHATRWRHSFWLPMVWYLGRLLGYIYNICWWRKRKCREGTTFRLKYIVFSQAVITDSARPWLAALGYIGEFFVSPLIGAPTLGQLGLLPLPGNRKIRLIVRKNCNSCDSESPTSHYWKMPFAWRKNSTIKIVIDVTIRLNMRWRSSCGQQTPTLPTSLPWMARFPGAISKTYSIKKIMTSGAAKKHFEPRLARTLHENLKSRPTQFISRTISKYLNSHWVFRHAHKWLEHDFVVSEIRYISTFEATLNAFRVQICITSNQRHHFDEYLISSKCYYLTNRRLNIKSQLGPLVHLLRGILPKHLAT